MNNRINRNATPPLTFLFSTMPGAGHMYLGLMRRGLEIMAAFFGSIFIVAAALRFAELGVPMSIIIFFYSIFEAQHLNKAISRNEDVQDSGIFKAGMFALNEYHIGIGIIILGLIFLMDRMSIYLQDSFSSQLYLAVRRSISPLLMLGIGIYLVLRYKKPSENASVRTK